MHSSVLKHQNASDLNPDAKWQLNTLHPQCEDSSFEKYPHNTRMNKKSSIDPSCQLTYRVFVYIQGTQAYIYSLVSVTSDP